MLAHDIQPPGLEKHRQLLLQPGKGKVFRFIIHAMYGKNIRPAIFGNNTEIKSADIFRISFITYLRKFSIACTT